MHLLKPILILCLISCSNQKPSQTSYWEKHKDNFRYNNKTEFLSDSTLRADYKKLNKSNHRLFDKITGDPAYLYSWQERDKDKNEFTIINDDGERGLKIFYVILDKKDSLISSSQIAGMGGEGGYLFETRSEFINKDTLLNIGSITLMHDGEGLMKIPKGDTTFSYMIIDKKGQITKTKFKEVKDLQYNSD